MGLKNCFFFLKETNKVIKNDKKFRIEVVQVAKNTILMI